MTSNINVSLVF